MTSSVTPRRATLVPAAPARRPGTPVVEEGARRDALRSSQEPAGDVGALGASRRDPSVSECRWRSAPDLDGRSERHRPATRGCLPSPPDAEKWRRTTVEAPQVVSATSHNRPPRVPPHRPPRGASRRRTAREWRHTTGRGPRRCVSATTRGRSPRAPPTRHAGPPPCRPAEKWRHTTVEGHRRCRLPPLPRGRSPRARADPPRGAASRPRRPAREVAAYDRSRAAAGVVSRHLPQSVARAPPTRHAGPPPVPARPRSGGIRPVEGRRRCRLPPLTPQSVTPSAASTPPRGPPPVADRPARELAAYDRSRSSWDR